MGFAPWAQDLASPPRGSKICPWSPEPPKGPLLLLLPWARVETSPPTRWVGSGVPPRSPPRLRRKRTPSPREKCCVGVDPGGFFPFYLFPPLTVSRGFSMVLFGGFAARPRPGRRRAPHNERSRPPFVFRPGGIYFGGSSHPVSPSGGCWGPPRQVRQAQPNFFFFYLFPFETFFNPPIFNFPFRVWGTFNCSQLYS